MVFDGNIKTRKSSLKGSTVQKMIYLKSLTNFDSEMLTALPIEINRKKREIICETNHPNIFVVRFEDEFSFFVRFSKLKPSIKFKGYFKTMSDAIKALEIKLLTHGIKSENSKFKEKPKPIVA
jgi:hypothetical protein